ncbi:hypothetical protein GQ457_03G019350 [Hibiscus cannabinus]
MISRKRRIGEFETDAATETCLAMMHNKVSAKKTDPGSFTIQCSIGHNYSTKALCDPDASINLMPKYVFQKLGIGEGKPTIVMLQLAGHSFVKPEGKIEDIHVRVDKFIFPADFLILECKADEHAPIILERPFLATGRVLLNFENNELVFRVDNQQVNFNAFKTKKFPADAEELAGKPFYCFLDGYSGYNQIAIAPEDQSKTTFTCPYGTFPFRRMSFGLCNAPATFQRCMTAIFSDMNEDCLEIFMDDFSTFGDDFASCLSNLEKVLTRCIETNLVLNWEKCHFMVDEGIILGHKISAHGMEVDRAKIDVISKLPPPTTVKGIRSFLGHAGFYRRSYLIGAKVTVYTDHSAIKYLRSKKDAKPRLICWILLLQEFNVEIINRKGTENQVAYHLSRLENKAITTTTLEIKETFSDEQLLSATSFCEDKTPIEDALAAVINEYIASAGPAATPWYADYVNYITKLSYDASQKKNNTKFWNNAIQHPMEDTSTKIEQQQKCCNQDYTGQLFTEMLNYFINNATGAKEQETFLKEMRCPYKISLKLNYLTFGE